MNATESGQVEEQAPDWSIAASDVLCPMCEYNLRGLTEARCPECGYQFVWSEMLDARRRPHPFLFEHHPEANVWSYRKTAAACLWPRRFWRSLHPAMPSRPGRLVLYWVIGAMGVILTLGILAIEWTYQPSPIRLYRSILDDPNFGALAESLGLILVWPWLTLLVLMIFQASMRKARVKLHHVLRCVMYCFGDLLWIAAVPLIVAVLRWSGADFAVQTYAYRADKALVGWGTAVFLGLIIFSCWRLAVAYRLYLQFNRPVAVAISSQAIAILAMLFVLLNTYNPVGAIVYGWLVRLMW